MPGFNKPLLDRLNAIFADEFEDMVKMIQGRHEKPRILYKSRSIKVTLLLDNKTGAAIKDFLTRFLSHPF